ncbi:MAG TPA: hypothetical protein VLK61_01715 [Aquabacterium sp.]|nr:hypothetical protein [Aquabacterium sp.]
MSMVSFWLVGERVGKLMGIVISRLETTKRKGVRTVQPVGAVGGDAVVLPHAHQH